MIKVSVIVPIYKVEAFIERCVRSLMEQTLKEVEYIFVDDSSPDGSISILNSVLKEYSYRKSQVRILFHEHNKGLPTARNTGLSVARGEYIFHCDSDDYVETDMLERLYSEADRSDADVVWCDWFLTFENRERCMVQPEYTSSIEALKAMLSGCMKFNVWNKLVKRALYVDNQIYFPDGYGMGEDMTMMMLFVHAKKVLYVPHAYYHYVKLNTGAFSQTYSDRHLIELQYNVARIVEYIRKYFGMNMEQELAFFKLDVKFPFLISCDKEKHNLWKSWYPEANKYVLQNKSISMRSRLLQWLACHNQFWAVRVYSWIMQKVVYGIIYK